MKLTGWLIALVALVCAETVTFAAWNWDLVYLSQPASQLAADPRHFNSNARTALARPRIARRHLETIATIGVRTNARDVALRALRRLAAEYPSDTGVWRRLGDELRRAGRYEEAERIYRRLLAAPTAGGL
jgi:hypothetical protein